MINFSLVEPEMSSPRFNAMPQFSMYASISMYSIRVLNSEYANPSTQLRTQSDLHVLNSPCTHRSMAMPEMPSILAFRDNSFSNSEIKAVILS
ncbi:hypothetical protein AVEN_170989-1 [Araneus ventricosus]|uniref:Uncharacterized protein n=1 Tax=Araneus ventricosus TaxID=182803 RepID=A0A4Y2GF30_ARAVE|nr:hypothetical protein AVEN_170989-1 [Araneus ventricosus]